MTEWIHDVSYASYDPLLCDRGRLLYLCREYLVAESLDKKKEDYDVSGWQLVNVKVRTRVCACVRAWVRACLGFST